MFTFKNQHQEPSLHYREECYTCFRAKKNCLCGSIRPFDTKMHFVILMHTKEARREKTGTARLAKACLKNSELLIGNDFTENERINTLIQDSSFFPLVLFPAPDAFNFSTLKQTFNKEEKKLLIIVIDGTWSCAKKILNRSKNLHSLPKLSFSGQYISGFEFKKQPEKHCISTIESIYYLCREAEETGHEALHGKNETLMTLFKTLVDTQICYQKNAAQTQQIPLDKTPKATRGIRISHENKTSD